VNRREFITLLGGAAAIWPAAARGQQPAKLPTIGYFGTVAASAWGPWTTAFAYRLRELGWIEGRTVAIHYRWAEGRAERLAEIAAEFVRLKVDVIGNAAVAAKQASSVIPIVFALMDDPVSMGLVASLARPGGNVTGLSMQQTELAGKRLELLREVVPGLSRLAIMANAGNPASMAELHELQATARTLALEVMPSEISRAEDIAPAFEALKSRAQALYSGAASSSRCSAERRRGRSRRARSNRESWRKLDTWAQVQLWPRANGPPLLYSDCANSAGSRAAT
jgi:putative ABC transport system substrate-binding protein